MTLTRTLLDTAYISWFVNKRNAEMAKQELLTQFSAEPDESHEWSEQDIYEQARKIIDRWDKS